MVKVSDIAYVTYQVTDLEKTEAFLTDFGMECSGRTETALYMRAGEGDRYVHVSIKGAEPRFLGLGFKVEDRSDLEAAARIPGASQIETIDAPGGGNRVRLTGPDGYQIDVVHDIAQVTVRDVALTRYNLGNEPQRVNTVRRSPSAPADIRRISHAALYVSDAKAATEWFTANLGLLVSDYVDLPDGAGLAACFMRADKGKAPSDHHTLAAIQTEERGIHHSSFWVQDFDTLHQGQDWLLEKGHRHEHGIGRHNLGSQVFDYWRDPDGFLLERFVDGDVFDNSVPPGRHPASMDAFFQWGPKPKPTFFASILKSDNTK